MCCLGLLSLGSFGFPDKVICHAGDHQHVTNKTEQYSNSVLVMRTGAALRNLVVIMLVISRRRESRKVWSEST